MSYLEFDDNSDRLILYSRTGQQLGSWHANNNVVRGRNDWPSGTYQFAYWVAHSEDGANGSYGSHGNFVFDVAGRSGMGVHSGRANARNNPGPDHPTFGCIRTTDEATGFIYQRHQTDPLTHIVVFG